MEKIDVTASRFKHSGLYSLSSYYNLLYDTFRVCGYSVEEFRFRRVLNPDGTEKELELFWNCFKHVDDYSVIQIFAKTLIVGISKSQTQIDGKPVERDKGIVELEMKASAIIDKFNKWEISPIFRYFKTFYDTYFYKTTFENIKRKLGEDHDKIENEMKAFFNMQSFL